MPRRLHRPLLTLAVVASTTLIAPAAAQATFRDLTGDSLSVSSATVPPPHSLTVTKHCSASTATYTLRWTAPISTYVKGYHLNWTKGGTHVNGPAISGRSTETTIETLGRGTFVFSLASTSSSAWTSTPAVSASATC